MRDPIREFGISDRASVAHCQRRHTARQVAGGAGVDLPEAAAGRPAARRGGWDGLDRRRRWRRSRFSTLVSLEVQVIKREQNCVAQELAQQA